MTAETLARSDSRLRSVYRCLPAAIFVVLGLLTLWILQTTDLSISGKPTRDFICVVGITQIAVYLWIRTLARVSVRVQVISLSVLFGIQLCLLASVRIDGFMGDGRPIFVWRWAEELGVEWAGDGREKVTETSNGMADLTTTTDFDWPGFRGADRTGIVRATDGLWDWDLKPQLLWRQPIGLGWSSFAVVGNHCVTQEQRGEFESVVCYELHTGREVWEHSDVAYFDEVTGGKGPRATPTIHAGCVYTLGATGILNCLGGSDGRRLWSTNILEDSNVTNALFGMTGSPLIVDDLVVVSPGGKNASLVAYDQQTGQLVWAGGDAGASYSSSQQATLCGQSQILIFNAEGLFGHDAHSGHVLWSYAWVSNPAEKNNVCQPVIISENTEGSAQIFVSSGYGQGCAVLEIRKGKEGQAFAIRERWRNRNLKAKFSSVVRRGKHVYGLDEKILVCIDLDTGKRCWKQGRYGYGQIALAGEVLIVQAETGEIAFVEASPDRYRELARFTALGDRTWNHPVLSGNILLVRNDREAACYQLSQTSHDEDIR